MRRTTLFGTVILAVSLSAAPGCGASAPRAVTSTAAPTRSEVERAKQSLRAFAAALRAHDERALRAVAHPDVGLWLWDQQGAYPQPVAGTRDESPLTEVSDQYVDQVASAIELGLRIAREDAGPYELPPVEEIDDAPAWAAISTRGVDLAASAGPGLSEHADVATAAEQAPPVIELHVERGPHSVRVFLSREANGDLAITHVVVSEHYSA